MNTPVIDVDTDHIETFPWLVFVRYLDAPVSASWCSTITSTVSSPGAEHYLT